MPQPREQSSAALITLQAANRLSTIAMPAWVSLCLAGRARSSLTQPPPCPSSSPLCSSRSSVLFSPALRHWWSTTGKDGERTGRAMEPVRQRAAQHRLTAQQVRLSPRFPFCDEDHPHLLATPQERRPGEGAASLGKRGSKLACFSDSELSTAYQR